MTRLFVALTLTALAVEQHAASQISSRPLPAAAAQAARARGPMTFISALAEAHVSGGVVLRPDEDRVIDYTISRAAVDGQADLVDVASAFQRTHDRYRITEIQGLIQVRPSEVISPCELALQRPMHTVKLTDNLHDVLNAAFALVNPDHPTAPPSLMQYAGEQRREAFPPVHVNVRGGRFEDVLNAIAEQATGFIWIIRPRLNPDQTVRSCTFDFIYRNASATTGWILPHESNRK